MSKRYRSIKRDFWEDEKPHEVSRDARLMFLGLLSYADDEGRLRAIPLVLKGQVFAYDETTHGEIAGWLVELHEVGLIRLYGPVAKPFAHVTNFLKHQRIRHAQPSSFPAPGSRNHGYFQPEDLQVFTAMHSQNGANRNAITVGKGEEGKGEEGEVRECVPSHSNTPPPSLRAHEGARTHEATPTGGVVDPAEPVAIAPTRPEQYVAEIQRCKRDLGSLSLDAQSAEAAMREDRGIDLDPAWLLMEFYRPASLLLPEYGRDATQAALASIVTKPGVRKPAAWMRTVAERAAAEGEKPKPVTTFADRKARDDKAAMLASLAIHTVIPAEPEAS